MENKVRITTLIENTAQGNNLLAEHGISFWLEYKGKNLLFDTGQTGIISQNAKILGIDFAKTEAIVISHGHFDHTGGLYSVLNDAKNANIYIHPNAVSQRYSISRGASHFVGIENSIAELLKSHESSNKVVWTKEPTEIFDGLFVTGQVPRTNDLEDDQENFFFLDADATEPDELNDDQSIFFETEKGIVVIFGCAHAGIINILDYITKLTGKNEIYAIMGGMHLVGASDEKLKKIMASLKKFNLQRIGPAHCTGLNAAMKFRDVFPHKCFMCSVGSVVEF